MKPELPPGFLELEEGGLINCLMIESICQDLGLTSIQFANSSLSTKESLDNLSRRIRETLIAHRDFSASLE